MANTSDPVKLTSPSVFLVWMLVFLVLCGLIAFVLQRQIINAFNANPWLNGLIVAVLLIGIVLSFLRVIRLFPEVKWVNSFRTADSGLAVAKAPTLLAPMAAILGGDRGGASPFRRRPCAPSSTRWRPGSTRPAYNSPTPCLNNGEPGHTHVLFDEQEKTLSMERGNITVACNLGQSRKLFKVPGNCEVLLRSSNEAHFHGENLLLPPNSTAILRCQKLHTT